MDTFNTFMFTLSVKIIRGLIRRETDHSWNSVELASVISLTDTTTKPSLTIMNVTNSQKHRNTSEPGRKEATSGPEKTNPFAYRPKSDTQSLATTGGVSGGKNQPDDRKCYNCGRRGHLAKNCRQGSNNKRPVPRQKMEEQFSDLVDREAGARIALTEKTAELQDKIDDVGACIDAGIDPRTVFPPSNGPSGGGPPIDPTERYGNPPELNQPESGLSSAYYAANDTFWYDDKVTLESLAWAAGFVALACSSYQVDVVQYVLPWIAPYVFDRLPKKHTLTRKSEFKMSFVKDGVVIIDTHRVPEFSSDRRPDVHSLTDIKHKSMSRMWNEEIDCVLLQYVDQAKEQFYNFAEHAAIGRHGSKFLRLLRRFALKMWDGDCQCIPNPLYRLPSVLLDADVISAEHYSLWNDLLENFDMDMFWSFDLDKYYPRKTIEFFYEVLGERLFTRFMFTFYLYVLKHILEWLIKDYWRFLIVWVGLSVISLILYCASMIRKLGKTRRFEVSETLFEQLAVKRNICLSQSVEATDERIDFAARAASSVNFDGAQVLRGNMIVENTVHAVKTLSRHLRRVERPFRLNL